MDVKFLVLFPIKFLFSTAVYNKCVVEKICHIYQHLTQLAHYKHNKGW